MHFEEKKRRVYTMFKIFCTYICCINIWNATLEVSGAVRPIYVSLGVKGLNIIYGLFFARYQIETYLVFLREKKMAMNPQLLTLNFVYRSAETSERVKLTFHSTTLKIKNKLLKCHKNINVAQSKIISHVLCCSGKRNWICYQGPSATRTKISEFNVSYFMLLLPRSCLLFPWEHSFLWDERRFANKLSSCLKKSRIQFPYKRNKTL